MPGESPAIEDADAAPEPTWSVLRPEQKRSVLVAVALLALAGLATLRPFLAAIGWGAIIALSLWPWRASLARRWPSQARVLVPGLITLLVLIAFVVPIIVVIAAIARESIEVAHWVAQAGSQGLAPPDFLARLPFGSEVTAWWNDNLAQPGALGDFLHRHESRSRVSLGAGGRILGAVLHNVLLVAFMLLTLFFMLRDGESLTQGLKTGSRRAFGPAGERVGDQIVQAIRGTVNGMVVVGFGEGVLMGAAYEIAGVPRAVLFGLMTGLLSMIPFGALLPVAAAVALLLIDNAFGAAVAIAAVAAVVIFVADHFVRPGLIGGATQMPFPVVLFGIVGGIEVWGLIGLVLGPALMAALLLLWREWIGVEPGPLNSPIVNRSDRL